MPAHIPLGHAANCTPSRSYNTSKIFLHSAKIPVDPDFRSKIIRSLPLPQQTTQQRPTSIRPRSNTSSAEMSTDTAAPQTQPQGRTLLCTSLTASTVAGMLKEAREAEAAGADIVELRLDFLSDWDPDNELATLIQGCSLPVIVTYRPDWEGGNYSGEEGPRLATLRRACELNAAFIDVELKAAEQFFASAGPVSSPTRVILSSHDYEATPSEAELDALVKRARRAGADVVKFATTARDVADAMVVLRVLRRAVEGKIPTIALAMAERGQITRILAPKYGGFLTFGALSPERASAPGQPTLAQLRELYRLPTQNSCTRVFGIVGNPVSHSKSPAIHNAAMGDAGFDGVYVPLLVDDMHVLLDSLRDERDWAGLSVTIPHKEAALRGAASSDEVAASIGAANTLVRQADGSLKAYNTDWSAAISAIERGMDGSGRSEDATSSPLRNTTVVVVGAGGAGRALAFGALSRGAEVIVANRTVGKAEELAAALGPGARAVALSAVASGEVSGDVLVNTTSVGMHPKENETPVPASALGKYKVVFDAVYTPLHTRLLKEAASFGCTIVTGDEMFVGQAADQFRLFTGLEPPVELMRQVVLGK